MTTKAKATKKVTKALGDTASQYDIEAIVEHLHDYIGSYDFTDIDQTNIEATAEEYEVGTLSAVVQVHSELQEAELQVKALVKKRSEAIQAALLAGHTQQAIGHELDVKQPRVAYMLKQGERVIL